MTNSEKKKATPREMLYTAYGFGWGVITTVFGLFVLSQIVGVFS
jgi:hypothetical protein